MGHTSLGDKLRGLPEAHAMYRDMGEDAARLGPWLLPFSAAVESSVEAWRAQTEMACFGISRLDADACRGELIRHLDKLRHVCALRQPSTRFFLRYADQRGVSALWPCLPAAQKRAFLGPIRRWEWIGPDNVSAGLVAESDDHDGPVVSFPLRLHARALQSLVQEARKGDLLVAAERAYPDFNGEMPLARRWNAARATWDWGQSRGIKAPAVLMASLVMAARRGLWLLENDGFTHAAYQAEERSDPTSLLDFGVDAAHERGHA